MTAVVGIIMGSDSDLPVMQEAVKVLKQFEIPYEIGVYSAHRSPHRTAEYVRSARSRGSPSRTGESELREGGPGFDGGDSEP